MVRTVGTTDRTSTRQGQVTHSACVLPVGAPASSGPAHGGEEPSLRGQLRRRDAAGFTLVELLITFLLISTAIVAIFAAWQGNIRNSQRHRSQAEIQTVLVTASEWITSRDIPLLACGTPDIELKYLGYADNGLPSGWDVSLLTVEPVQFWDHDLQAYVNVPPGACPRDTTAPQLVTLTLNHPDGDVERKITVMKANV